MSDLINRAVDIINDQIIAEEGERITKKTEDKERAERLGLSFTEDLSLPATLKNPFDIIFYQTVRLAKLTTNGEYSYQLQHYVSKLFGYIERFKRYIQQSPFSSNELPSLSTLSEQKLRDPSSDSVYYPLRDDINRSFGSIGIKPYTDDDGDIIRDESYFLDETERILDVLEKTKKKIGMSMSFQLEKKEDNKTHLIINDKRLIIENGFYKKFLDLLKSLTKQTGGTKRRRKSLRKKSRKSLRKKTRRKRQ